MHHQIGAGAPVGAVIGVRVADVEGQMIVGVRVHLARPHRVEPFRSLAVALGVFGAELPRPLADVVFGDDIKTAVGLLLPDLDLALFLEDAPDDRGVALHALGAHFLQDLPRAAAGSPWARSP